MGGRGSCRAGTPKSRGARDSGGTRMTGVCGAGFPACFEVGLNHEVTNCTKRAFAFRAGFPHSSLERFRFGVLLRHRSPNGGPSPLRVLRAFVVLPHRPALRTPLRRCAEVVATGGAPPGG